ncbi:MAG: hypothetical protein QM621_13325 [Aeromicrobium sp.]|uniref:hypothetical protein n=1 Tax=Aeromicrobium sp. TaxID=1871063 RepID=UPI0039E472DE
MSALVETVALLAQNGYVDSSQDGETPWILLLLGPAGAGGVYWMLFRFYRNTDKTHAFERETRVEAQPISGNDVKIEEVRGTTRSAIQGDNSGSYRQRVRRLD